MPQHRPSGLGMVLRACMGLRSCGRELSAPRANSRIGESERTRAPGDRS